MQLGIYIHFPYCLWKCPYCDFASRAEAVIPQERYTEAVVRELRGRASEYARPARQVVSIYFGGGTPSLWDPSQVGRVLAACRDRFDVQAGAEVTLEANPGTTDEGRFTAFRALGFNRLSIGVQSFTDSQLHVLGRKHSACDAERAFRTARAAGFDNVSLDLIHGGSGHTVEAAARDAASAVALGPEHVSAYALTLTGLAEDVPMAKAVRRGEVVLPSDDEQAAMGEAGRRELSRGGDGPLEISNFARKGYEAVHNTLYWRGIEYVAAGCGACGFARGSGEGPFARRYMNDRSPERYLARVEETGTGEATSEEVDREQHLRERLFTGLRLAEGLDLAALEQDLGVEIRSRFGKVIDRLRRREVARLDRAPPSLSRRGVDPDRQGAVRLFLNS